MRRELHACAWPMSRAGEALEALARASHFPVRLIETTRPPDRFAADAAEVQSQWLGALAVTLGFEIEAVEVVYADIDRLLCGAAPALLRISDGTSACLLAVRTSRRSGLKLVTPELSSRWVRINLVRAAMRQSYEEPLAPEVERLACHLAFN